MRSTHRGILLRNSWSTDFGRVTRKMRSRGGNSGDGSRWQGNEARSDVGVVHGGEAVGDGGRSADGR